VTKRILVACEESQILTTEFRLLGLEAYSCDILPTSGKHKEWHLQQDVIPLLDQKWDAIFAFPPCTHLAASGARWFKQKQKDGRQKIGIDFFMSIANADCDKILIENPVGIMSKIFRKPDQIIHPWMFGHKENKATCLWLKNLPPLMYTCIVEKPESSKTADWFNKGGKDRQKNRSKTFTGIAEAMANQWG
jgi:site-specific DNA-cytosine methylase